ncbi:hypothetical protein GF312_21465 [Candidatus Poribacteria bacterium]|nr:hypothetical protein [Candidatus Poribacteria bacterium]
MLTKELVKPLPDKPGVYFFRSRTSEILYIGKAKSLKKRVRSYTYPSYRHSKRTRRLVRRVKQVDYTVCGSELEALLLESRLIKEHLPEYNVAQKRLRNFPFVKITMQDDFPKILVSWEIESDGAKYLGPFSHMSAAQETVDLIINYFPVRKCDDEVFRRTKRPCLEYHLNNCTGPCCGKISREKYRNIIGSILRLLGGQKYTLIRDMEKDMREAAEELKFEKAARLRDHIDGLRKEIIRRKFRVNSVDNNNLIAIYPAIEINSAELFFIRKGALVEQKTVCAENQTEERLYGELAGYIKQIFFNGNNPDKKQMTKLEVDAMNIISRWLYRHRNDQSLVHIKRKRNKTETINSAAKNVINIIRSLS